MPTLRLLDAEGGEGHQGEVFCCAYTPDGNFVLSGGWDGYLRLWNAASGAAVSALQAGPKAISACAVSPDGHSWLSGSMEGMFTAWDPVSHQVRHNSVAHIRPISGICFSPDGKRMATCSWDRQVIVRGVGKERDGRTLSGHTDIVAGCCFLREEKQLLSWSHDGTLRLWEAELGRSLATLRGHSDRVVWAGVSPDDRWAASAGRDGQLKLWDLGTRAEAAGHEGEEWRTCFFLPDGSSLVAADAKGQMQVLSVPALEVQADVGLEVRALCGALAPSGTQLALGAEDGRVHLVAVDGLEDTPLTVTATEIRKATASVLGRLLGKKATTAYRYTCPTCRHAGEVAAEPGASFPCGKCRRPLRLAVQVRQLQPQ
jgi:WD40 repeat protein